MQPSAPSIPLRLSASPLLLWSIAGFLPAFPLLLFLLPQIGVNPLFALWLTITALAAFLLQAFAVKIIFEKESYVFYRQLLLILAAEVLMLCLSGQPVRRTLDVFMIAFGIFHAFARVGCYKAGCCHGLPAKRGVRYQHRHGIAAHYVNVPLFPIQLLEALGILLATGVSALLLFRPHEDGVVLATYLSLYAALRFALEFFRGDADRPYKLGLSEAQWTSALLAGGLLLSCLMNLLPVPLAVLVVSAAVLAVALALSIRLQLFPALHLQEAQQFDAVAAWLKKELPAIKTSPVIRIKNLPHGINLSLQKLNDQPQQFMLAFSHASGKPMKRSAAKCVRALSELFFRDASRQQFDRGNGASCFLITLKNEAHDASETADARS